MADWALVVGIDRYLLPQATLHGAVRDALTMRQWLIDPAGGAVPETNVTTLLSPRDDAPPPDVPAERATHGNILEAVHELIMRSGGEGERLYVFFAGHGVSTFVEAREENALVAEDFTPVRSQNSIALDSLWEYLETWQFKDQFLFVDACRNIPVDIDFHIGQWTLPRKRNPGMPPVQQFILYATSPGLRATETGVPGDERGHFSDVLRAGLQGAGVAKAWSQRTRAYEVRWQRLVRYVTAEMERRRIVVGGPDADTIVQIPQEASKHGVAGRDDNPVLARFAPDAFEAETLTITISPDDVHRIAEIVVNHDWGEQRVRRSDITRLPLELELEPNLYILKGSAPHHHDAYLDSPVELYAPVTVDLVFEPADADRARVKKVETAPAQPDGAAPERGRLVVRSDDPLAPVEVADAAGRTLGTAAGVVALDDLDPGVYRATLRTPENDVVEQLVEVTPGAGRDVALTGPTAAGSPAVASFVAAAGGTVRDDSTVELQGGQVVVAPRLSTMLGTAGQGAVLDDMGVRGLGLSAARDAFGGDAGSGLYVIVGVDGPGDARDVLGRLDVRVWPLGEPVPPATAQPHLIEEVGVAGEHARSLEPGAYWLALEFPDGTGGRAQTIVTVAVFPGRVTLVTVELGGAQPTVFQYAPSTDRSTPSSADAIRRFEMMERLLVGGQFAAAFDVARDVLGSASVEPLGTTLACYVALRAGRIVDADAAIERLVDRCPHLGDVHVLRGECDAAAGLPASAANAFGRAVAAGAPVFAEGLTRLLEGARAYAIEHRTTALVQHIFERHLTGSMWSAWRPGAVRVGQHLVP